VNATVTDFAALTVTVDVLPEVVSAPIQAVKVDVESGAAVSVTTVPALNASVQVPDVQDSVPGDEVSRPPPGPDTVTASG
jgi:hypothetical protein